MAPKKTPAKWKFWARGKDEINPGDPLDIGEHGGGFGPAVRTSDPLLDAQIHVPTVFAVERGLGEKSIEYMLADAVLTKSIAKKERLSQAPVDKIVLAKEFSGNVDPDRAQKAKERRQKIFTRLWFLVTIFSFAIIGYGLYIAMDINLNQPNATSLVALYNASIDDVSDTGEWSEWGPSVWNATAANATSATCEAPAATCCHGCVGAECNECEDSSFPYDLTYLSYMCCPPRATDYQFQQQVYASLVIASCLIGFILNIMQYYYMVTSAGGTNHWKTVEYSDQMMRAYVTGRFRPWALYLGMANPNPATRHLLKVDITRFKKNKSDKDSFMKRRLDDIARESAKIHAAASSCGSIVGCCSNSGEGEGAGEGPSDSSRIEVLPSSGVPDGADGTLDDLSAEGGSCFSLAGVLPSWCTGASGSADLTAREEPKQKKPFCTRCKLFVTNRLPTWMPGSTKVVVVEPDLEFARTFPAKGDNKSSPTENVFRPKPCPFLHRDKLCIDIKETEWFCFTRTYRYYVIFPFASGQTKLQGDLYGTQKHYDSFDGDTTSLLNKADIVQIKKRCQGTCGWLRQKINGFLGFGPFAAEIFQELSQRADTSTLYEALATFNQLFISLLGFWAFVVAEQTYPWQAEFYALFGYSIVPEEDLADSLLCYGCGSRGVWANILDRDQAMQEGLELAIFGGLLNAFGSGVRETKDIPDDDTAGKANPHDVELVWHADEDNDDRRGNGGGGGGSGGASGGGGRARRHGFEVLPAYFGPQSWASLEMELVITYAHWAKLSQGAFNRRVFKCVLGTEDSGLGFTIKRDEEKEAEYFVDEVTNPSVVRGVLHKDVQIISIAGGDDAPKPLADWMKWQMVETGFPVKGPFTIKYRRKYVVIIDETDIATQAKADNIEDATLCLKMARKVSLDELSLAVVFARHESHYVTAVRGATPGKPKDGPDRDAAGRYLAPASSRQDKDQVPPRPKDAPRDPLDRMHIKWELPLHTRSGMQIKQAWRTASKEKGQPMIKYLDAHSQVQKRPPQRPRIAELPAGQFIHKISSLECNCEGEGPPTDAVCQKCPTILKEMQSCIKRIFGDAPASGSGPQDGAMSPTTAAELDIVLDRGGTRITGKMNYASVGKQLCPLSFRDVATWGKWRGVGACLRAA